MNFRKVKQILNRKLIEIWSYRKKEQNACRRLFTQKHVEKKQKERLMRRCRNLELRIELNEEINKIEKGLKKIYKNMYKTFKEYCACREQIIEFKGRYYDFYEIHCKYYEEVLKIL